MLEKPQDKPLDFLGMVNALCGPGRYAFQAYEVYLHLTNKEYNSPPMAANPPPFRRYIIGEERYTLFDVMIIELEEWISALVDSTCGEPCEDDNLMGVKILSFLAKLATHKNPGDLSIIE